MPTNTKKQPVSTIRKCEDCGKNLCSLNKDPDGRCFACRKKRHAEWRLAIQH